MSIRVQLKTGEDGAVHRQDQAERIAELKHENAQLKAELARIQNWPDEITERGLEVYGSVSAWRNRALIAERKLEHAYARLRERNL